MTDESRQYFSPLTVEKKTNVCSVSTFAVHESQSRFSLQDHIFLSDEGGERTF